MKENLHFNSSSLFMAKTVICQPKNQANSKICQLNWLLYDFLTRFIELLS